MSNKEKTAVRKKNWDQVKKLIPDKIYHGLTKDSWKGWIRKGRQHRFKKNNGEKKKPKVCQKELPGNCCLKEPRDQVLKKEVQRRTGTRIE